MRGRGVLVVALAAAALVPAASASGAARVKLALIPLPKAVLGTTGRPLALSHASGGVSNTDAANSSNSATPAMFKGLGRVSGYVLTYGDRFSGGAGITEIATGVEEYRTVAGAKHGLAFWRKDDARSASLSHFGVTVVFKALKAPAVGTRRFGYGSTVSVPNAAVFSVVDERFADGRYVLNVSAAAGSLSVAVQEASKLARTLDHRLRLAETGRLRGKSVKLLPRLKPGRPAGGPDLATAALTTSDLTGTATVGDHTYVVDPIAASAYLLDMNPAGQFVDLGQEIAWFATANEAVVQTSLQGALLATELPPFLGGTNITVTDLDLSSVGDNAQGVILRFSANGLEINTAIIGLSRGQASDLVLVDSKSPLQASAVQGLAHAAAAHLDAGVTG